MNTAPTFEWLEALQLFSYVRAIFCLWHCYLLSEYKLGMFLDSKLTMYAFFPVKMPLS